MDGEHILEFISGGPKQYAYRTQNNTVIKLRGFTLNSITARELNFVNMRRLIKKYIATRDCDQVFVVFNRIERLRDRTVITKASMKTYRVVYEKRRLLSDGSSLPYGYK